MATALAGRSLPTGAEESSLKRLASSILTIICLPALALMVAGFSPPAQAQTAQAQTAQAQSGTQAHETHAASDGSSGDFLDDIWTRDKLTGDWGGCTRT